MQQVSRALLLFSLFAVALLVLGLVGIGHADSAGPSGPDFGRDPPNGPMVAKVWNLLTDPS